MIRESPRCGRCEAGTGEKDRLRLRLPFRHWLFVHYSAPSILVLLLLHAELEKFEGEDEMVLRHG
jgi:hypothetical protein